MLRLASLDRVATETKHFRDQCIAYQLSELVTSTEMLLGQPNTKRFGYYNKQLGTELYKCGNKPSFKEQLEFWGKLRKKANKQRSGRRLPLHSRHANSVMIQLHRQCLQRKERCRKGRRKARSESEPKVWCARRGCPHTRSRGWLNSLKEHLSLVPHQLLPQTNCSAVLTHCSLSTVF